MPFNPRITMEYVGVRQLDPNEQGPAYLDFRGFLFGKDVERVEIYHNGVNVGQLGLGEPDPETGRRYFSYMLADAKGLYTLVAHDVHGEKHKKSYEFFSRTVGRARNDYGTYVVPYNSEEIGTFDPRLDRLFRGGPGSSGDGTSASAFATF
jgi:hypothetical protein